MRFYVVLLAVMLSVIYPCFRSAQAFKDQAVCITVPTPCNDNGQERNSSSTAKPIFLGNPNIGLRPRTRWEAFPLLSAGQTPMDRPNSVTTAPATRKLEVAVNCWCAYLKRALDVTLNRGLRAVLRKSKYVPQLRRQILTPR